VVRKVNYALDRIIRHCRGHIKTEVERRERLSEDERLDYVLSRAPLLSRAYDLKETFRALYRLCENYEDGQGCIRTIRE